MQYDSVRTVLNSFHTTTCSLACLDLLFSRPLHPGLSTNIGLMCQLEVQVVKKPGVMIGYRQFGPVARQRSIYFLIILTIRVRSGRRSPE
jgi:hypothetical protein